MVSFNPPAQIKPVVPPRGHFLFANRTYKRVAWWRNSRLRTLYFWVVILVLTNTANGFDGSMMNGLQALDYWQDFFDSPSGSILGFFNASMSLGSLVALPLCPPLVDRFGRKMGIVVGSFFLLLGVGLQAGANGFGMFVGGRFLLGFGMSITLSSAPLLIAEISHPQDRAILSTFMGCTYHSGAFIAAWTTYGTLQIKSNWSWRLPSSLQCACTIIILGFLYWIPESPRWLIDRDRNDEALEIIAYYFADGNKHDDFVQLQYTEIRTALAVDKQNNLTSKWSDFFKTPGNRKRIGLITAIGLFSQWSGNGILSYYLSKVLDAVGITSPNEQLGLNGGMKASALFFNFFFALFVDRFGRRPIYLVSTVGTLFAFTVLTIISARYAMTEQPGLGKGVIAMIFIYDFFYNVKSGLLNTYSTEILPYGLRAKGYAWLNFSVILALFFNQYANAPALEALAWKYYIFYCVFLVFEVVVIYLYVVETRYTPMEEIAKYFDGPDAEIAELTNAQHEKGLEEEGKVVPSVQEVEVNSPARPTNS